MVMATGIVDDQVSINALRVGLAVLLYALKYTEFRGLASSWRRLQVLLAWCCVPPHPYVSQLEDHGYVTSCVLNGVNTLP